MNRIILLTATGGRPDSFKLCEKWISRQKLKPDLWIVSDDCFPRTELTLGQVQAEAPWERKPGLFTQHWNLLLCCKTLIDSGLSDNDEIFIIEDDDYYGPGYLESLHKAFSVSNAQVVGEAYAKYYHVSFRKWSSHPNVLHASLCQTAFKGSLIQLFQRACSESDIENYIDQIFWDSARKAGIKCATQYRPHHSVGIKGMGGAAGASPAHLALGFINDPEGKQLIEWIGEEDARVFLNREYNNVKIEEFEGFRSLELLNAFKPFKSMGRWKND